MEIRITNGWFVLTVLLLAVSVPLALWAGEVTIKPGGDAPSGTGVADQLHAWTKGNEIKAAEVNHNFKVLADAATSDHSRLSALEGLNAGSRLTAVEVEVNGNELEIGDLGNLKTTDKSSLVAAINDLLPVGTIVAWDPFARDPNGNPTGSRVLPSHWKVCNGAGGAPDLRDRFIYGANDLSAYDDVYRSDGTSAKGIGGEAAHSLTEAEMPGHTHTMNYAPDESACQQSGCNKVAMKAPKLEASNVTGNNGVKGDGQPHNNLPPYVKLVYIIKIQ